MSKEKSLEEDKNFHIVRGIKLRKEDFSLYKPKKYYSEPEDNEKLREKLLSIENCLEGYKYKDDIPRFLTPIQ